MINVRHSDNGFYRILKKRNKILEKELQYQARIRDMKILKR